MKINKVSWSLPFRQKPCPNCGEDYQKMPAWMCVSRNCGTAGEAPPAACVWWSACWDPWQLPWVSEMGYIKLLCFDRTLFMFKNSRKNSPSFWGRINTINHKITQPLTSVPWISDGRHQGLPVSHGRRAPWLHSRDVRRGPPGLTN